MVVSEWWDSREDIYIFPLFSVFPKCFLMSILKLIHCFQMAGFVRPSVYTLNILHTDLIVLFGKGFIFTFKFYLFGWAGNPFVWFIIQKVPRKV